jgi:hypothetical protein
MSHVARLGHFISRHRLALRDLTVIALVAGLGMTLAYWVDVFPNDPGALPRRTRSPACRTGGNLTMR